MTLQCEGICKKGLRARNVSEQAIEQRRGTVLANENGNVGGDLGTEKAQAHGERRLPALKSHFYRLPITQQ